MSYYIDHKESYLQQYEDVADKLVKEMEHSNEDMERTIRDSEAEKNRSVSQEKSNQDARLRQLASSRESLRRQAADTRTQELNDAAHRHANSLAEAEQKLEHSMRDYYAQAPRSLVTMPPYLKKESATWLAPVLASAPELAQIQSQAASRTYLPQVLVGTQNLSYGKKACVLPAYADWQTTDDKTTATEGNILLMYDRQACQKQALNMADSMIYRMMMAFPAGSLHLSIMDPTSMGVQRITKMMEGCDELYSKQVFEDSSAIDKHLEMLVERISDIKGDFSRTEMSLVQHNQKGIKHGYELVIFYDPFSERPSYTANLKKLMANGISAGIYLMIIQSEHLKPEVLHDFEFGSFSTVIMADKKNFLMYKGNIRWDKQEFSGKELLECNYLPIADEGSELTDPMDISRENTGLVAEFFSALSKGWKKATKSLTTKTWQDWNQPYNDVECWTKGIEVPIGVNADNKAEMYYRVRGDGNTYAHSFVQGMTGSGKSKLLSGIISSVTMKYSPKAVQLYLFDFKDGLAFRCYKGVPHMRWLVTTQADKTMFLSVLHDLEQEKEKRNKLFTEAGVHELEAYNKKMLEAGKESACLPRILLVVDECQDIYKVAQNKALSPTQKEINQIFEEIAKKYRADGIHLLLSSQQIPGDMTWIGQISNNYILNVGNESCNALLPANSKSKVDNIKKRIGSLPDSTGAYSTVDDGYLTMYGYEDYPNAGEHILERAKALLGSQLKQFECKVWDGELDVPYCKIPAKWFMEFGSDTIGSRTIGSFLEDTKRHSNVLLYGAQGGDRAQQLTMRTVLTSLRGAVVTRAIIADKPEEWPTIYVANAWSAVAQSSTNRWAQAKTNPVEQSQKILDNLAQHGFIQLLDNEQLGKVLLELNKQIENKQRKSVLLYLIGANEMDVFKAGAVLSESPEKKEEAPAPSSGGFRWGQSSAPSFSQAEEKTGLDVLATILREGAQCDIHTVLQVNTKDDMESMRIGSKDFQYIIFQQAKNFSYWPDNTVLSVDSSLEDLPIDPQNARTIFFDSANADEEQYIIPFMLDELSDAVRGGKDVGQYIMDNTKREQ